MRALHNTEIDHPEKGDRGEERRSQLQILPTAASLFHPVEPFGHVPGIPLSSAAKKPVGAANHFLLILVSAGQHHEERRQLLRHPKRGVGGIISNYVIISQSSSSTRISSIGPSSSSMTSWASLDGILDLVPIHLNLKHSLDETPRGDLCTFLQLFSHEVQALQSLALGVRGEASL